MINTYSKSYLHKYIDNKRKQEGAGLPSEKIADYLLLITSGWSKKEAAEELGIKIATARSWGYNYGWFDEATEIAREVLSSKMDSKFTRVLEKSIRELQSRLDKGDPYVLKDGSIEYKPVTAHHAAQITSIIFDKRALLRNQPTSIKGKREVTPEERLFNLGKQFEEMGKNELTLVKNK